MVVFSLDGSQGRCPLASTTANQVVLARHAWRTNEKAPAVYRGLPECSIIFMGGMQTMPICYRALEALRTNKADPADAKKPFWGKTTDASISA